MQDLKLSTSLPALSFDYEGLKAWALNFTEKYRGLVVTEDAIADVKRDMADINKAKKAVDDARKEAVRRVSEPIRYFEAQVKEICSIFDTAYAELGAQVKSYEDAQREEKRKEVEGLIIEANMNAFGSPACLLIPLQDKWLNKTTSLKSVREDIAAIIEVHRAEEQRRKELEQAKQDRAAAIENHVVALNSLHGLKLPLSMFLGGDVLSLDIPLAKVLTDIESRFKIEADRHKAEETSRAAPTAVSTAQQHSHHEHTCPKVEQQATRVQTRAMSIVLEYDLVHESEVKECLKRLEGLCHSFGARTR